MNIKIKQIICKRCQHQWTPRKQDVRQCPKCKTAYFDIESTKEELIPND